MIADFLGIPRDMSRGVFRAMAAAAAACGLVVPLFGGKPVRIMIASQAVSPIAMPLLAVFVTILLNKKAVVGENRPGLLLNTGLIVTGLFSLYMFTVALTGFVGGA